MAIKVGQGPSTQRTTSLRPSAPRVRFHRSRRQQKAAAHHDEHHDDYDHDLASLLALMASRTRRLNSVPTSEWTPEDFPELIEIIEEILERTEEEAKQQHPNNPHEQQNAVAGARLRLRMLLQTLQPPPELVEPLTALWNKLKVTEAFELNTFARKTLMNNKVRQDVMHRHLEESVDEADHLAAQRRVEAIDANDRGSGQGGQSDDDDGGGGNGKPASPSKAAAKESGAGSEPASVGTQTLKYALKQLKKKRRNIGKDDAEQVAQLAFDTMRVLRDEIAPRWAPETQPWLVNTADNHIFQSVLAVIPEALIQETNAFDGIQNLRKGELAFGLRAADAIVEAAKRTSGTPTPAQSQAQSQTQSQLPTHTQPQAQAQAQASTQGKADAAPAVSSAATRTTPR